MKTASGPDPNLVSLRDRPSTAARAPSGHPARVLISPQVLLPGLAVLIGVALVASPFLATTVRSVLAGPEGDLVPSLRNFAALFQDQRFYSALGVTVVTGLAATALSCFFGLALAWIVARTDTPGRSWFDTLNLVPFFLSPFVGAVSWT